MKRFIIAILLFVAIPFVLLVGIYVWTDPFRCVHPFDINDVDATNREYLSTELFLRNYPTYHYNSFIFASSRGGGLNTYQWKQYLPEGAQPFLFQAWAETLTGIEMKIEYLSKQNIPINNALVLLDIPSSFAYEQLPTAALTKKHFIFTGQSRFAYNMDQFTNFIQKPSLWMACVNSKLHGVCIPFTSDTITNDYIQTNYLHYSELPEQDSLKQCSKKTRRNVLKAYEEKHLQVTPPLITEQFAQQLRNIRNIFERHQTNYQIVLSPAYCYLYPAVSPDDKALLELIFGEDRVHDYTGYNEFTNDYNNFSDPNHFGLRVGYLLLEDIYK